MAILRTRSGSLNISLATRLGLKRLSVPKVIHFNVPGDPSEFPGSFTPLFATSGPDPIRGKESLRLSGELM